MRAAGERQQAQARGARGARGSRRDNRGGRGASSVRPGHWARGQCAPRVGWGFAHSDSVFGPV